MSREESDPSRSAIMLPLTGSSMFPLRFVMRLLPEFSRSSTTLSRIIPKSTKYSQLLRAALAYRKLNIHFWYAEPAFVSADEHFHDTRRVSVPCNSSKEGDTAQQAYRQRALQLLISNPCSASIAGLKYHAILQIRSVRNTAVKTCTCLCHIDNAAVFLFP